MILIHATLWKIKKTERFMSNNLQSFLQTADQLPSLAGNPDDYPPHLICPLNDYDIIQISGVDSIPFMQGQFTCDVKQLSPTQSLLGAHCNAKGRVHYFFRLFEWKNNYYLKVPSSVTEHAFATLKQYALFSKVSIEILKRSIIGLGLSHTLSEFVLAHLNITVPSVMGAATYTDTLIVIRISGTQRFELYGDEASLFNFWQRALSLFTPVHAKHWRCLDIWSGLPNVYAETQEYWLPHPLRLPELDAVNFKKGCYLGQEIIARTQYLGNVKKHLQRFVTSPALNIPLKSALINAAQEVVGEVVDAQSDATNTYLLAVILDEAIHQDLCYEKSPLILLPLA
jgi:folate-binding protein YgfZ